MKKFTYFIAIAACAPFALLAQPNITSADFPTVASNWADMNDSRTGAHTVGAGGANMNWDYSTGYFIVSDTSYNNFILPSAVPHGYGSNFPTSDLAQYSEADSMASFFELNTTGLYMDGQYQGSKMGGFGKVEYSPDILYVPAPATYNTVRNNNPVAVLLMTQGTTKLKYIHRLYQKLTCDAWGTMKTPYGTYSNTLRIHSFTYTYDTILADPLNTGNYTTFVSGKGPKDTTDSYMWYSATQKAPVVTVDFDGPASKSVSSGASYANFTLKNPAGVKELNTANALKVYPNPAAINQPVYFSLGINSTASNLIIYNTTGQLVRSEQIAGATQVILQTNEMPAGLYLYSITDKSGAQVKAGKFLVGR